MSRIPLKQQKPFQHVQQKEQVPDPNQPPDFVIKVQPSKKKTTLAQDKQFVARIKSAWQTGSLQLMGLDFTLIPDEIINIENINLDGEQWWQKCPISKMDLSNNQITHIPYYDTLPDLIVLRMNQNRIESIDDNLSKQFYNLKSLSLSQNLLKHFYIQLPNLVELNLADNKLEQIELMNYENLEAIDLQNNQIAKFPILPILARKVNLSVNRLNNLPKQAIQHCSMLEDLILSKNQITDLEQDLFKQLQKLKILDMKENKVQAFTQEILGDDHIILDSIQLSFNNLQVFDAFSGIPNLTVLLLNNNKIKNLSQGIINLKNLRTLDLQNNDLGDLPKEIGFLPQLVRIQLEGNPLKCIRQSIRSQGAEQLKKYLKSRVEDQQKIEQIVEPKLKGNLYNKTDLWDQLLRDFLRKDELIIRQQNLQKIDGVVFLQQNLIHIDLSNNQIDTIPSDIYNLQHLKKLCLNDNKLNDLPVSILELSELQELELQSNKLSKFPYHLQNKMKNLNLLDLSKNNFLQIPAIVLDQIFLQRLLMGYNKLEEIEILVDGQQQFPFEVLDISNNKIEKLDDRMYFAFPNLQHLNISNNDLKMIPTLIGFMNLKTLQLDGNPTKLISRQLIDKGTPHILEYLKNKHPYNQVPPKLEPLKPPSKYQQQQQGKQADYPEQLQKPSTISKQYQNPQIQEKNSQLQQQQIPREQQIPNQFSQPQQPQINRAEIQIQLQQIDKDIKFYERELADNFSLNNFQKQEKRKQLQQLMLQRSSLIQQLQ